MDEEKLMIIKICDNNLGSLLFKIYMGDLFCLTELADVFNCGDDTAAHSYDLDINSLVTIFVYDSFFAMVRKEYHRA